MTALLDATDIAVDSREEQLTASYLSDYAPTSYVGELLVAGDVWWGTEAETYGGELKSGSDFLSSLWSKERGQRLEWQLAKLRDFVDVPFLAIHGLLFDSGSGKILVASKPKLRTSQSRHGTQWVEFRVDVSTGWNVDAIYGFLWSIQYPTDGKRVGVITQPSKPMLMRQIAEIYWWSRKATHQTFNSHVVPLSRITGVATPGLRVLTAIEGIGEETARSLLDRCGQVVDIIVATDGELLKINGVGKKTVERLRLALGRINDG